MVPPLSIREFADIDVAVGKRNRRQVTDTMEVAGLEAEPEFNAPQGARRQIWWTPDRGRDEVGRAPKSRSSKLRARVGRRKRWYEIPDESIT